MARLAITMSDPPRRGLGAFMPSPYGATTPAASSGGVIRTEGHPGTLAVPAPRPAATTDDSWGNRLQPSACAPDTIRPDVYVPHVSRATTGLVPTRSSNIAPVPAGQVVRSGTQTQKRVRVGGRTVTGWPRQYVRWPTYKETRG